MLVTDQTQLRSEFKHAEPYTVHLLSLHVGGHNTKYTADGDSPMKEQSQLQILDKREVYKYACV